MNRNMKLPAIQRIAMEFERENDIMEQRQEMMDDAIDDTFEDEEEESDEIVNQVLDEIGIDLGQSVLPILHNGISSVDILAWRNASECSQ
jgi:charged multivesicular body protein 2A